MRRMRHELLQSRLMCPQLERGAGGSGARRFQRQRSDPLACNPHAVCAGRAQGNSDSILAEHRGPSDTSQLPWPSTAARRPAREVPTEDRLGTWEFRFLILLPKLLARAGGRGGRSGG